MFPPGGVKTHADYFESQINFIQESNKCAYPAIILDVIARNVKQVGDGVVEVRRYNDGHIRADLSWVWFFMYARFYVL